jgi:3-hydroxymyristoyl/3-hydroxydecanoyl-(acyl carrier protein) dehydratase
MIKPHTPHGPGFRFLDTFRIKDQCGIGEWHLAPTLWFFKDHFPGNPLAPAALLLEFAAQTAGALWMAGADSPDNPLFVAAIDAMRIQGPAIPGETLTSKIQLVRELGTLAQFEFEVGVGARPVARGRITLSRLVASA